MKITLSWLVLLPFFIAACTAQDRVLLGPKANPDKIYFIPLVDTEGCWLGHRFW